MRLLLDRVNVSTNICSCILIVGKMRWNNYNCNCYAWVEWFDLFLFHLRQIDQVDVEESLSPMCVRMISSSPSTSLLSEDVAPKGMKYAKQFRDFTPIDISRYIGWFTRAFMTASCITVWSLTAWTFSLNMYAMASLSFFLHESCARKKDKKTKYDLIQLIVPLEVLVVVLLYWPLITVSSLQ